MKRFGKLAVCLAGGLALNAGLRADDSANPYATIVERNIFGLTPITTVATPDQPAPPVKITPNGIMNLLGRLQVLFKTAGGPAGKEQSYMLTEGQRQDDIEVTKINEKAGIVTFNNHGVVQALPLANAPASTTTMPAVAATPYTPAGVPNRNVSPAAAPNDPGNRAGRFGNFGGRNPRGAGNGNAGNGGGDNSGGDSGLNLRNIPTRNNNGVYQPEAPAMTPEESVILIEAQRAKYQAEGNPMAKLLPPTSMPPESTAPPEQ